MKSLIIPPTEQRPHNNSIFIRKNIPVSTATPETHTHTHCLVYGHIQECLRNCQVEKSMVHEHGHSRVLQCLSVCAGLHVHVTHGWTDF